MANSTVNNILQPITIYKEFTVLGCANVSGNSFVLAPMADVTDSIGTNTERWNYIYGQNIVANNILVWTGSETGSFTINTTAMYLTNTAIHVTGNNLILGNIALNSIGNATANSSATPGYTVLPGGVIMQWGTGIANAAGNVQNFPFQFPVGTVLNISVTGTAPNNIYITANSNSSLTVASGSGNGDPAYNFIVLGL